MRSSMPGVSLHRQVFLVLRDRIVSGALPAASPLPTEGELCEQFGVSRITVRRALADLTAQGLVERRHGVGSFVQAGARVQREQASLDYVESLRQRAAETKVTVLGLERVVPPADIAAFLGLQPADKAVHVRRLRRLEGQPVMLTEAWVPLDLGQHVTALALRRQALYEIVQAQGVTLGRVVQEITAVAASPEQAQHLATEPGAPVLQLVRLMHGRDARPIEHLTVWTSPERSRIVTELTLTDVDTLRTGRLVHDRGRP
ncbi:GntR family transcriptional regulator [Ramlibacter sp. G-1-2-2]|uniref:GntR family transcriptional regulator n=1 Tax=Ramlibacter agri TaxID=2728837 RepID=A0A848H8B6_9BURK|nr:GntR family transcriptional regulator [Ramlibacter agri]NML46192.1 GntR family transcriptional regulator [Ramlibacter agri]